MAPDNRSNAARDAAELLSFLEQHPDEMRAIADAIDPEEVGRRIRRLPGNGAQLVSALVTVPEPARTLKASPSDIPELRKVADWILSYKAPLEGVADTLRARKLTLSLSDVVKNPVYGMSSHCTYYLPGGHPVMHVILHGRDDEVILENAEPIDEVARTASNLLRHVALVYKQLKDAGCSLDSLKKDVELRALATTFSAIRSIARSRGISFRSVMERARQLEIDQAQHD